MASKAGSGSNRLLLREAINTTIDGCGINDWALAQKAQMSFDVLSKFRDGSRDLTTKTLDSVTRAFATPEFQFFLEALEGDEGATANTPAPEYGNLIQHPAFNPLVSHVVKYCGADPYHKLIRLIVYSHHPDKNHAIEECGCSTPLLPFIFFPARLGMREALNATLNTYRISNTQIAKRIGLFAPALSAYRSHCRDMYSKSMDQILATLSTEQYLYFTGIFRGALELLEEADPTLAWPQYQDDPEHQYRAFCALLSQAANHCTLDQFDDLFCMMVESREMARKQR